MCFLFPNLESQLSVGLDTNAFAFGYRRICVCAVPCVPVHYLRDPQVRISTNFYLKLNPTALFIYLKIILLQYFQFSTISGIQIDP